MKVKPKSSKPKKIGNLNLAVKNPDFDDELQRKLEYFFSNGFDDPYDLKNKLKISIETVKARLKQIYKEYGLFIGSWQEDYTSIERARLIKGVKMRRQRMIEHLLRMEDDIKAKKILVYPEKLVAAIRDDEKWLATLLRDIDKSNKGNDGEAHDPDEAEKDKLKGKVLDGVGHVVNEDDEEEFSPPPPPGNGMPSRLMADLQAAVAEDMID